MNITRGISRILIKNICVLIAICFVQTSFAQVVLENEIKITDLGLHFDGNKVGEDAANSSTGYDYAFGPQISAHGDCITTYKNYVFVTWYKGGKNNRNMMLTRYNTITGTKKTIEFPHRHTGFRNIWWIGESHNTIAVGVSPLDGTIHLLFDMHAYSRTRPADGSLSEDYFRYAYSVKNAAEVSDDEFVLSLFVEENDVDGDYTHLSLNGVDNHAVFSGFTYPQFFLNDLGDLFFSMRKGSSPNGGYHFAKYDASSSTWSDFIQFAQPNASNFGQEYNWGMYGSLKYLNGKIGIGFQRRLNNQEDKYLYQNGFYYGYSDDQSGASQWKNHKGEDITIPLRDADDLLVYEPGDLVETTQKNMVYMVGGFDWTVTQKGDVHIIGRVRDDENNVTKHVHTYKPNGASDFITSTDFSGASTLYTSGNDIFIIGLNSSGQIFVEKSEGGTNNFVKVYEATSGKRFRHGVVTISDGKLYYYLMERQSGDQQPLYLQIIDLDIAPTDPTLPNNFTIQAIGETCTGKENGVLNISGAATHDYIATIDGVNYDFTNDKTIEGLSPGTYDLCIEVVGENYTHCYEVTIAAAEGLTGKISISKKSATVSVQTGKAPFTVIKNGQKLFETNQLNFSVDVNHGDSIQIKSKEACQGEMVKTVNLLQELKAYPNPANGLFEMYIPNDIKTIDLEVYNMQSQLIVSKTYIVNAGKVQLNLEDKPNGIYFVKVNAEQPVFVKVIKK